MLIPIPVTCACAIQRRCRTLRPKLRSWKLYWALLQLLPQPGCQGRWIRP